MIVPQFLLKRLYVKGSLRNTDNGFEFQLKNSLGSGYGTEILPLTLDGEELPKESSYFTPDSEEIPFTGVSKSKPFTLAMNKTATISVKGTRLAEGPHKIGFSFVAQGLGNLHFEVTDAVADA
ncbi:hypothetical protein ACFLVL_02395 [Chloroflexota bacterium]